MIFGTVSSKPVKMALKLGAMLLLAFAVATVSLAVGLPFSNDRNSIETAWADDPTVVASGTKYYIDWKVMSDGELIFGEEGQTQQIFDRNSVYSYDTGEAPWLQYKDQITKVSFVGTVRYRNFDSADNRGYIFAGLTKVTEFDFTNFDTSIAEVYTGMFYGCASVETLDLSSWKINTDITDLQEMFWGCNKLKTVIWPQDIDTSNVTTMLHMFDSCQALQTMDLSAFSSASLTNAGDMFSNCRSLTGVTFGENFTMSSVTNIGSIFYNTKALVTLDLRGIDWSSVKGATQAFSDSRIQTILVDDDFNMNNLENAYWMFANTTYFKDKNFLAKMAPKKLTNVAYMFYSSGMDGPLSFAGWNTSNVTSFTSMMEWSSISEVDISSFNTKKATGMTNMISSTCSKVTLGPDFSFTGKGTLSYTLPGPPTYQVNNGTYANGLEKADGSTDVYTPAAMATLFQSDPETYSGTWQWAAGPSKDTLAEWEARAKALKPTAVVSANGLDVPEDEYWVPGEIMDALDAAIAASEELTSVSWSYSDKTRYAEPIDNLKTAIRNFNNAKSAGLMNAVTVTVGTEAEGVSYNAYELFSADIDENNNATHIAMPSTGGVDPEDLYVFLYKHGYDENNSVTGENPTDEAILAGKTTGADNVQNMAEYVAGRITADAAAAGATVEGVTGPVVAAGDFAMDLAKWLADNGTATTVQSGQSLVAESGYYLLVSNNIGTGDSASPAEAGTAPIWYPLGDAAASVVTKEGVPTIDKKVEENSTGVYGDWADASAGEKTNYQLVATLPSTYRSFSEFSLMFTDTLPIGMTAFNSGTSLVTIEVVNGDSPLNRADITDLVLANGGTIAVTGSSATGQTLAVSIPDIKAEYLSEMGIVSTSEIVVTYQAALDASLASTAATGNLNTVDLEYTADPVSLAKHVISDLEGTKTFMYGLDIAKQDKSTGEPLSGVTFTLQAKDSNDNPENIRGKFVTASGTLEEATVETAYKFATDAQGQISITGLESGTYVLHEVAVPAANGNYALINDVELVVASTFDDADTRNLATLAATKSGGTSTAGGAEMVSEPVSDVATGRIALLIDNDKELTMPLTGGSGLFVIILAGLVLIIGSGVMIKRNREAEEE